LPFSAVLFDLDGTLLNTLEDLADSMNAALAGMGLPQHPLDAYRYFVGDGVETLADRALPPERNGPEIRGPLIQSFREIYSRNWAAKTRPYAGIPALLQALASRDIRTVVLSNKPDAMTRLIVAHYFPAHPFAFVQGARPEVPKKPDPAAALGMAHALGLPTAAFLYAATHRPI